ncbi:MAG: TrmH family RNA methyltransferase [Acidimicrobiales bacterium]
MSAAGDPPAAGRPGRARSLNPTELKRLHREWRRRTSARTALLLDAVQTPYNVGSIVRMAAAYRVEQLWLAGGAETPAHPGARKTALGAERFVAWSVVDGAAQAVEEARAAGFRVVGVELAAGAAPLHELDLSGDVCLAFGHEDRGLSAAALAGCDAVGFIPQLGKVGSLNVAMSAAIALYELRRQEWTAER